MGRAGRGGAASTSVSLEFWRGRINNDCAKMYRLGLSCTGHCAGHLESLLLR